MDKTGNLSQRTKKILDMVIDARKEERERIDKIIDEHTFRDIKGNIIRFVDREELKKEVEDGK